MESLPSKEDFIESLKPLMKDFDCAICGEDFSDDHPPVKLGGCEHVFGKTCITQWFDTTDNMGHNPNTCPICRREVFLQPGYVQVFPYAGHIYRSEADMRNEELRRLLDNVEAANEALVEWAMDDLARGDALSDGDDSDSDGSITESDGELSDASQESDASESYAEDAPLTPEERGRVYEQILDPDQDFPETASDGPYRDGDDASSDVDMADDEESAHVEVPHRPASPYVVTFGGDLILGGPRRCGWRRNHR